MFYSELRPIKFNRVNLDVRYKQVLIWNTAVFSVLSAYLLFEQIECVIMVWYINILSILWPKKVNHVFLSLSSIGIFLSPFQKTSDMTGQAGVHYKHIEGTLTFQDGELSQDIEVELIQDINYNQAEKVGIF